MPDYRRQFRDRSTDGHKTYRDGCKTDPDGPFGKKGNEALEKIKKQTGKNDTIFMVADLASFKQIHELSESLHSRYGHLDVLINNAGLFVTRYQLTEDGHELQLGVNHLAPFLLTHLLHDLVEKSGQGRIINISSRANYS
jgi:NAD(P)-dependent dehydrogenase (short-subunit alcohol dehydrogenase family)